MMNVIFAAAGGAVYFCEDPRNVMDTIGEIKPAIFIGVPRFYEKVYEGFQNRIGKMPAVQKGLVKWAVKIGDRTAAVRRDAKRPAWMLTRLHAVVDGLLLRKMREVMGGEMRYMVTGSAPCPTQVLEFFDAVGIPLVEAYGMSENIVPIASNRPGEYRFGSVGKPLKSNQVRLSPEGEVLVKGPGVFSGYYRAEKPRQGFTEDGFYASSDYGFFDERGFLYLIGRKSEIIKTSTGRRISLAHVEEVIREIPLVDQVVVVGSGRKALVGLVTLNEEMVGAQARGVRTEPQAEGSGLETGVIDRLAEEIARKGQALKPYERLRGCIVFCTPFTVDAGELTLNLKVKRNVIEQKYGDEINQLYAAIGGAFADSAGSASTEDIPVMRCLQKRS
jgi:long-chain acyl-CoA synthetase